MVLVETETPERVFDRKWRHELLVRVLARLREAYASRGRAAVFEAPREALKSAGAIVAELGRNHRQSFCCGAGGAQMWKEEEHGEERVSVNRLREAQATGKDTLAVGCPFCMIMLSDAATTTKSEMKVRDVAEIVAESLVA